MSRKSNLSIRAAVMNCLARCAESAAPLCCLGEFLEKLSLMGWHSDDVFAVERSVLHLLGKGREHVLQGERAIESPAASSLFP